MTSLLSSRSLTGRKVRESDLTSTARYRLVDRLELELTTLTRRRKQRNILLSILLITVQFRTQTATHHTHHHLLASHNDQMVQWLNK